RPVIVAAHSPVLAGMARRAGAGLAYHGPAEFAEVCELLIDDPALGDRLGRSGADFVARTYTWSRVVDSYLDLFAEVRARLHCGPSWSTQPNFGLSNPRYLRFSTRITSPLSSIVELCT